MSRGKERLVELYGEDHPAFGSYLECMSRANLTAVAAFTLSFSSTYIAQTLLKHKLPYPSKFFILSSTIFASIASYKVSKSRSEVCQAAWLAAEDKATYFTHLEQSSSPS